MKPTPSSTDPFGEDAPDAFDPSLPLRFGAVFETVRRVFRHEVQGLENLPATGPALLVLNHGPFPVDAVLLSHVLRTERGRWPRFLGERMIFESPLLERSALPVGRRRGQPLSGAPALPGRRSGGGLSRWRPRGVETRRRAPSRSLGGPRRGSCGWPSRRGCPSCPIACPKAEDLYLVLNDGLAWGQRVFGDGRNWPLPVAVGLGLLPFPVRLVHHVGAPIRPERRPGETVDEAIERLRLEAEASMLELLSR
jgi:hypothetical protein